MTTKKVVDGGRVLIDPLTGEAAGVVGDAALVRTIGVPGILETRTGAISDGGDVFTDVTAPAFGEIITFNSFSAGKKQCNVTYHPPDYIAEFSIPTCFGLIMTLNADDDINAQSRLTITNVGGGDTGAIDTRQRFVKEITKGWNLEGTDPTIQRLDIGGLPVPTYQAWATGTAYIVGSKVVTGGFILRCVTAGTSHASAAPAVTLLGQNFTDNTVIWIVEAKLVTSYFSVEVK